MKTTFTLFLLCLLHVCNGQKSIARWSFDRLSDSPDSGRGIINTIGGAAFSSYVGGNPSSGKAYGTKTYPAQLQSNNKAGICIRISTIGYKAVFLNFDQYNSNTASRKTMVMVSTDSINFKKADSLIISTGTSWASKTIDLSSFRNLNDQPFVYIVLVSSFVGSQYAATGSTSAYSTSGTWRFDNIVCRGTPVTKPKLNISTSLSLLDETRPDTVTLTFKLTDSIAFHIHSKISLTGKGITTGDYTWIGRDSLDIAKNLLTDTLRLKIFNDAEAEDIEAGIIIITSLDTHIIMEKSCSFLLLDDDSPGTPISAVQGKSAHSNMVNDMVIIEGIVTADMQAAIEQGGFYMQDPSPDNDPLTSEGIFVKGNNTSSVEEGDLVRVTGIVSEDFGQTSLKDILSINILSQKNDIPAISILFPLDSVNFLERFEGMKIKVEQALTVTDNYSLGRYGEITASVNGRLFNPVNLIDPNDDPKEGNSFSGISNFSAVAATQSLNARNHIIICDRLSVQNPNPIPFIDSINNTLRSGSMIDSLTGILGYDLGSYRVYPSAGHPHITYAPRPEVPVIKGANLKAAGMNVLNYFNGDGKGTGFPTLRGAESLAEFQRQRAKIIAAIKVLDADVLGLMEMENDGDSTFSAIKDLITGLNIAYGSPVYDYIRDPKGINGNPGTDDIKIVIIYKVLSLSPSDLPKSFNDQAFTLLGRPPLAQTFILKSNGEKFTLVVNHFKSKGCSSNPADPLDNEQEDGQGCFNAARKKQAHALITFVHSIIEQSGDSDILCLGDYNAYEQEDPLDILRANGLVNLAEGNYSYVFGAQAGSLDHGFATPSMYRQMIGADKWHINCDEPPVIDYTLSYKTQDLYSTQPYRSSDHDPLITGFNLIQKSTMTGRINIDQVINIYPQPNTGAFTVDLSAAGPSTITILNSTAQPVYSTYSTDNLKEISTALPAGFYYVIIENKKGRVTRKLVIR